MRKFFTSLAVIGLLTVLIVPVLRSPVLVAQQQQPETVLNVRDYGAVGDGVTDDTVALQAVAADVVARTVKLSPPVVASGEATFPAVEFPPGVYRLTGTVEWGQYSHLTGQGSVIIRPDAGVDAFGFSGGFNVTLSNLTFIGGASSILFHNNNVNGGRLTVRECRFQATTGPTIQAYPNAGTYFSDHVTITGCKWFACNKAIRSHADITTLRDCWLQWNESCSAADTASIEILGGRVNVLDSMFVPVFPSGANGRRWISWTGWPERNSGSGIFCDRTEFHGEFGGLPPFEFRSGPDTVYPFQGPSLVCRGCQLSCGQVAWPDCAVINCNGGLPQTVSLDGCSNVIGPCPLIRDASGTTQAVLTSLSNGPDRVRILIGANVFYPLNPPVPAYLQPYVRTVAN